VATVSTSDYKRLIDIRGTASGWVGETAARTATNTPQLAERAAFMGEIYANPQVTQQSLDDLFFDVDGWLAGSVSTEFAKQEGVAFTTGDGVNKPKGFLNYTTAATADGARADAVLEHIPTGIAGDFAASNKGDVLLTTVYKLKAGHRAGAVWMTNKALLGEIRAFKESTTNAYIWQPGLVAGQPSTLLGYPVYESEDMPAKAANALAIAFGNFRAGYCVVDRVGVSTLRDPFTNKPYVGFYTTKRVGGMLLDSEAIKVVRFATT
jgi:HK97 family phage major capsid protein